MPFVGMEVEVKTVCMLVAMCDTRRYCSGFITMMKDENDCSTRVELSPANHLCARCQYTES